jgi:hypothetical protein
LQRAVHADIAQVQADDAVEGGHCFGLELFEHAGLDPFVASGAQGGVGYLAVEDRFDVDPRGARDETDQDPPEAQPVRHARPVTAEWVGSIGNRQQRFDRCPDGSYHSGLERAHDVWCLHLVVV